MGRPRGMRNAAMLNGRITTEQMEWLQEKADELDGNLSAALRQALTDARLLEIARLDYRRLRDEEPDWCIPMEKWEDGSDGPSRTLAIVLGMPMTEVADSELRELEARGDRLDGRADD
jgi:hypothetical protein